MSDYEHDPNTYVPMGDAELVQCLHNLESGMGVAESVRTALAGYELSGKVAQKHANRVRHWWKNSGKPSSWPDPTSLPRGPNSRGPDRDVMPAPPGGRLHILPNTRAPYPNRTYGENRERAAPEEPEGMGGQYGELMDDDQDGVIQGTGNSPRKLTGSPHIAVLEHLLESQFRVLDFAMAKGDKHQATVAIQSAVKLSRELKIERAAMRRAGLQDESPTGIRRRMKDDAALLRGLDALIAYAEAEG